LKTCPECQADAPEDAKFCAVCGKQLQTHAPPPKIQASGLKKKRNKKRDALLATLITVIVVGGPLLITIFSGGDNPPKQGKSNQASVARKSPIPAVKTKQSAPMDYEIIEEDLHEGGIKAQVVLKVLVSGNITKRHLEKLLRLLYDAQKDRTDFKAWDRPTHIFIYAYTDHDRAETGYAWIGMLDKVGSSPEKIKIKEDLIAQLSRPSTMQFGLSEEERIRVYQDYYRLEGEAIKKAERQYPIKSTNSVATNREMIKKQSRAQEAYTKQFRQMLVEKHNISLTQLNKIIYEGVEKDWPTVKAHLKDSWVTIDNPPL